ncbi:uncharacterized protein [Nicotiana sylvestris]|uniref:uncharacterized protein n=1 Tax=Nicotiana sylvestris TaxID=4096 RepID=UPI00388C7D52
MESVRHKLNPYVHSYLIWGCSLALQVWLYECCSTVSTDLATRCSSSIPCILRWSASKGQIWLAVFEEEMIKPEWIKFTNIGESGEEIAVLNLPDNIEYKVQEGEQTSEVPNADPPTLEPKQTDGEEDKESIAKKIIKLEKGIEQVDGKLEDFRKAVFVELDSLRGFINEYMQTVLQMINSRNVQDDAKYAGSSTKNNDQQKDLNNQHFQFNIGEQVQSPIHGVTVAAQTEQVIEEHDKEGADAQYVDLGDSEGSEVEKKGVTLDDFELPDNLSQLVKFGEPIQDDAIPMHPGRTRHPEKHARSPFIPLYSSGDSVGPKIFYLKHPFTTVIGEDVDPEVLDNFNKWLYHCSDKGSKRRKAPFSIKDNQIKPWLDLGVEKHIDVLMYYLRKRGKYGSNNKTRFTTTDYLFKTRIEQIYEKFINSLPQKKYSVIKPQDVVAEYILGQLYAYDSMVSSCNHQVVEYCAEKFSVIILLYLSCTGFYGKRKDINFKNTKAYIEKLVTNPLNIQWIVGEIPQ